MTDELDEGMCDGGIAEICGEQRGSKAEPATGPKGGYGELDKQVADSDPGAALTATAPEDDPA